MDPHPERKLPGLDVTIGDDGLALKPVERELLERARLNEERSTKLVFDFDERRQVIDLVECVGRLRLGRLASLPDFDATPVEELRQRIRLGIERVTRTILEEDDRLRFEHTIGLRNLTGSYVALGGDLELEAQVSGAEYARLAGELTAAVEERSALREAVDRILDAAGAEGDLILEAPRLEDLRAALDLAAVLRGRA